MESRPIQCRLTIRHIAFHYLLINLLMHVSLTGQITNSLAIISEESVFSEM